MNVPSRCGSVFFPAVILTVSVMAGTRNPAPGD
jgi:hypothetical protein